MQRLSVIIPVYNEIKTIEAIIRRVRAVSLVIPMEEGCVQFEREMVIVDDGSVDGTRDVLQAYAGDADVILKFHERNQGKGGAVCTGLRLARGDIMVVQDADLEYDPGDYRVLLALILAGRGHVAYGSRFLGPGGKAMRFQYRLGNGFLTWATNVLFGSALTDMETCYKMFTREAAQQLRLVERGWGFDPEITAQLLRLGYPIYEAPISYAARSSEEGKKISWRDAVVVLKTLLRYRFSESSSPATSASSLASLGHEAER
jgi:glycosyltransferase involved in cell wall biosynthesis